MYCIICGLNRWRRPQWQWGCTSWKYHWGVPEIPKQSQRVWNVWGPPKEWFPMTIKASLISQALYFSHASTLQWCWHYRCSTCEGCRSPLCGRATLQTAKCLSCIFHRFGFCVFRTLDRAVRECVPYGCAFLTKGNAARWCVIHTCCPAQTTIPVQDASGKLFVAVIGSSRPWTDWTVICVQDRSRGFPDGILCTLTKVSQTWGFFRI